MKESWLMFQDEKITKVFFYFLPKLYALEASEIQHNFLEKV